MSTPRRGPAGTGDYEGHPDQSEPVEPPDQLNQAKDHSRYSDPVQTDPNVVTEQSAAAERRSQATAKISASIPAGSVLLTSRTPEPAPYNISLDGDNVFTGGRTPSGFIVWYCPIPLLERMRRHTLVVSGRVVLPEGMEAIEPAGDPKSAQQPSADQKGE